MWSTTAKRRLTIERWFSEEHEQRTVMLITARCGHQWTTDLHLSWYNAPNDVCRTLERLLDRHESRCTTDYDMNAARSFVSGPGGIGVSRETHEQYRTRMRSVRCRTCNAEPGKACRTAGGNPMPGPQVAHAERRREAEAKSSTVVQEIERLLDVHLEPWQAVVLQRILDERR